MKQIPLTQDKFALVDDEDFEMVSAYKWHMSSKGYAKTYRTYRKGSVTNRFRKALSMHRILMDAPDDMQVDHANSNKLDNRRQNLRLCTASDNAKNRSVDSRGYMGYKGVHPVKGRFGSSIRSDGRQIFLGYFGTPHEAAIAYNHAALKFHGEFAHLNKLEN